MDEILKNLDPETKEKFEKGELGIDDLKGMGLIASDVEGDDSYGDAEGEENVDALYGSEEGE